MTLVQIRAVTESAGKEGLILPLEEEVCARPRRMGQFFKSFRTRHGEEGHLRWRDILGKSRGGVEMQHKVGG